MENKSQEVCNNLSFEELAQLIQKRFPGTVVLTRQEIKEVDDSNDFMKELCHRSGLL